MKSRHLHLILFGSIVVATLAILSFYVMGYLQKSAAKKEILQKSRRAIQETPSLLEYLSTTKTRPIITALDLALDIVQSEGKTTLIFPNTEKDQIAHVPQICERLHVNANTGICITRNTKEDYASIATVFSLDGTTLVSAKIEGVPSRARISEDSRYAGFTTFAAGDSYAGASFSTRTYIMDIPNKTILGTLETFTLEHNGKPIKALDINYWGVTFQKDSNRFYATVRYDNIPYLVEGNIAAKHMKVLFPEVECPSLSPDERHIVFKKRTNAGTWRLAVLDLASMTERLLGEDFNIDDQVEWLNNDTILYAAVDPTTGQTNIMQLSLTADQSTIFLENAYSPAVIR